ncbi:MAG: hypothetical protein QNK11_02255 [Legionella sp.]|nr:hypothetical protein [Legionella sp.]
MIFFKTEHDIPLSKCTVEQLKLLEAYYYNLKEKNDSAPYHASLCDQICFWRAARRRDEALSIQVTVEDLIQRLKSGKTLTNTLSEISYLDYAVEIRCHSNQAFSKLIHNMKQIELEEEALVIEPPHASC